MGEINLNMKRNLKCITFNAGENVCAEVYWNALFDTILFVP